MTNLLNHFLLFILAGSGMLLVPLLIGRFLRPKLPSETKDAIYECGEPTIGSSYIQFDLRFYTVALLFIIFDVEIAFFFPWALVYGNAMQLAD
ncbi:MAG: NADH-quinone oxidoreductase subunit A, partial [Planctomycetaceae bacterium]